MDRPGPPTNSIFLVRFCPIAVYSSTATAITCPSATEQPHASTTVPMLPGAGTRKGAPAPGRGPAAPRPPQRFLRIWPVLPRTGNERRQDRCGQRDNQARTTNPQLQGADDVVSQQNLSFPFHQGHREAPHSPPC